MSDAINITFMWPANCGEAAAQTTVILRTTAAVMQKRDPDGTSLVSGKLRFTGSNDITISAVGPEEDEFFSPTLVEFLADYIRTGSLDCPPDAQGDECERALSFFGFGQHPISIPEDDPAYVGKLIAYGRYLKCGVKVPLIVEHVKKVLLSGEVGLEGCHLIVDDGEGQRHDQFGAFTDTLIEQYKLAPRGAVVQRLGKGCCLASGIGPKETSMLLGGMDTHSRSLRKRIAEEANALGGVQCEWKDSNVSVRDDGEYGQRDFFRDSRWVLQIRVSPQAGADGITQNQGIKRRKMTPS